MIEIQKKIVRAKRDLAEQNSAYTLRDQTVERYRDINVRKLTNTI